MERYAKFAFVAVLAMSFWSVLADGHQPQAQNSQAPDQAQQQQQEQQAQTPPHTDVEPHPSARSLEHTIMDALKQDPHMAYSRVRVHVTDTEVLLTGVVVTNEAKEQAAQIATQHAGGRKVVNHIKVNANIHSSPGI